jgi:hypothetical protein
MNDDAVNARARCTARGRPGLWGDGGEAQARECEEDYATQYQGLTPCLEPPRPGGS